MAAVDVSSDEDGNPPSSPRRIRSPESSTAVPDPTRPVHALPRLMGARVDLDGAVDLVALSPSSCTSVDTTKALVPKKLTDDDDQPAKEDVEAGKAAARKSADPARRVEYATLAERKLASGPLRPAAELQKLWALSLPIMFTYVLEFLPGVISIMLVGRMDSPLTKEYVDGATLSSMFIYLSGEAPGFGLATALDTLCSQAYGAGKPQRIGISFQTGILVLATVLVPVFWLNWYSADVLTVMHQPEEVTGLAGRFSRLLLPGLPFLFLYELLKKVLQAQNIVAPMVWIAILSNAVNIGLGVYLTWYTPLGYEGAAIARSISNMVLPLATIPYFMWKPENFHVWWPGWQPRLALKHIPAFLTLGIPGMFMLVLEWLSYEIMAVFVGLLPHSVVAISVHSVLSTVANIAFHFFIGVGVATNVLVGNYVGSGQKDHAKMASRLGLSVSMGIAVLLVAVIGGAHHTIPEGFINDNESVEMASTAILYLIPFELLDAANCVMQGVFRGTGRQTFAAVVNLVCYFVIGLPCGFLLAFQLHMGVQGFWLGLTCGYMFSVALSYYKIWTTDWDAMVEDAKERTET